MASALIDFDRDQFLREYWQRKPLLIAASPGFKNPMSADELAGLAMEDTVESRIIEQRDGQWLLSHGPFVAADFQRQSPWTLLVQAVDHYLPQVAALRQWVNFLPTWRIDDVMVSYAEDGGSVGPHFDNYDVFLLQGSGQRRWRLGQRCAADEALLPHEDLRILHHFEQSQEFLLGPGEILYIPPGLAHWGIAQGDDCMTYSIGFRAPRVNDMVARWVDKVLESIEPDSYYRDPPLDSALAPGEISQEALRRAITQLQQGLASLEDEGDWFGELVTEPRYPTESDQAWPQQPRLVELNPAAKLAWMRTSGGLRVFANGEGFDVAAQCHECLQVLLQHWRLQGQQLSALLQVPHNRALLQQLQQRGCLHVR